ncbi:hypothetical protein [Murinocardiopsis flavida]|uniref:hypothetical protein n=1 Tax=Murinocardiopsis flavida TaxID=645275 RepID=UPI0011B2210D|nr:hypothetical protein [Murinocardiopsis flavida]
MTKQEEGASDQLKHGVVGGESAYPDESGAAINDPGHQQGEINVTVALQVEHGLPGRELEAEQTRAVKEILEWVYTEKRHRRSLSTSSAEEPPGNPPSGSTGR